MIGCLLPGLATLALGLLAWWLGPRAFWLSVLAACLAIGTGGLAIVILMQLGVPRLGYQQDALLIYTGEHRPAQLPISVVECFFLGQAPTELTHAEEVESKNLVVRLAERAADWHHRDIKRSIGHWCDGYITINGVWCEPIDAELIQDLNQRLVSAKRAAT